MEVFVSYDDPSVQITGNNDPMATDLVAHFLGLVSHDNDNSAPAVVAAPEDSAPKRQQGKHALIFPEARRAAERSLEYEACFEEAYARALEDQLRSMRITVTSRSHASWLFEINGSG